MPKSYALLFSVVSMLLMVATAISISHNGWIAGLFLLLTFGNIGAGFIVSAKMKRRNQG